MVVIKILGRIPKSPFDPTAIVRVAAYHLTAKNPPAIVKCQPSIDFFHCSCFLDALRRRLMLCRSHRSNSVCCSFSKWSISESRSNRYKASNHSPMLTPGSPFSIFRKVGIEVPRRAANLCWDSSRSMRLRRNRLPRSLKLFDVVIENIFIFIPHLIE